MKAYTNKLLTVAVFCFFVKMAKAQDKSSSDPSKSYIQLGVKYLSDNVYLGRKDSAAISYITPTIGYFHKSGLYLTAGASYQPNNGANRIDLVTVEAGYDFSIKDKFYGGFYAGKYFFSGDSYAVNAEVNTGLGAYGSLNTNLVTFNAGAGMNLSSQTDIITNAGISKTITDNSGSIEWEPGALLNAGTQNYYNLYFTTGRVTNVGIGKGRGRGNINRGNNGNSGNNNGGTTTVTNSKVLEASRFKILDYEVSAPLSYTAKNFKIKFTPTLAIPVNAATIETDQNLTKENLSNHFFAELELTYKLK